MTRILVSGLINLETTLKVDGFPIPYFPVTYPFFGVNSSISGVGFNLSKALTTLGDEVAFCSLVGRDLAGEQAIHALQAQGIDTRFVLPQVAQTAQSVILYEPSGRRQIYTDLKDIQEQAYPPERFDEAARGCELVVLCNINFSRPLLSRAKTLAPAAGDRSRPWIACDVHALENFEDEYNRDFMAAADILFLSHERLPVAPEAAAQELAGRYGNAILVIGLGSAGALLRVERDGFTGRFPAVYTRPVINTIGAGDALFSAFLHSYARQADPYQALRAAMVFASYKIGTTSAADGFLDEAGLQEWISKTQNTI